MIVQLSINNNKFFLFLSWSLNYYQFIIRNNVRIKGIKVDGNKIKLVTFANDMTSFLRDKQSRRTLLEVIKSFGRYLGLRINQDKMEAFVLEITY